MYNRWTTYTGPWDDNLAYQRPSTALGLEVDAFKEQLGLKPDKGFPKNGVVTFPNEDMGRGHKIVVVVKMTYPGFKTIGFVHTPLFVFDLVVNATKKQRILQSRRRDPLETLYKQNGPESPIEPVYKGKMFVTFMDNYPNEYPTFKLPEYDGFDGSQHGNHMFTGGRMCLYGDYGHSVKAWDPEHGTAAEAFGPAMKWIVWHERDREQGVDANDINYRQR